MKKNSKLLRGKILLLYYYLIIYLKINIITRMSTFRKANEFDQPPSYLNKLRVYFDRMVPQMIRLYNQKRKGEKGCWITTILPSLVERQVRMSTGNLNVGASMIESEFTPASSLESAELREFLNNFEIENSLPLIVVNSVKTMDNAHLIIVGNNSDQTIYDLGDY